MNCSQISESLPLFLYGDLSAADRAVVENHLANCKSCRCELEALAKIRQLLGLQTVPEVRVDVPRLYQQEAERQQKRLRHWRRTAALAGGIAALFAFLALGPRFEAHVEAHQLVLRWGHPPVPAVSPTSETSPAKAPELESPRETQTVSITDDQVQVLGKLIRALVDDLRDLDRQRREDASRVQARLQAFQQQNLQRCADLQHSIDGLYLLSHKGE